MTYELWVEKDDEPTYCMMNDSKEYLERRGEEYVKNNFATRYEVIKKEKP